MLFKKLCCNLKLHVSIKKCLNFSLKKIHFNNDQIVSGNDQISLSIKQANSVKQLFNIFDNNNVILTARQSWIFSCYVLQLKYKEIYDKIESIHSYIPIAFIQLQVEEKLNLEMNSIISNPHYLKWCNSIITNLDLFNNKELCDCILSISYLGMTMNEKLFLQCLENVNNRFDDFDIIDMSKIIQLFSSFPGYNFKYLKIIIDKTKFIFNDKNSISNIELQSLAIILLNLNMSWITNKTCNFFLDIFIKNLCFNKELLTINNIELYIKVIYMFFITKRIFRYKVLSILNILSNYCLENTEIFSDSKIAEICRPLKTMAIFKGNLASKLELRSLELLSDNCRLTTISNLMQSLSSNTSLNTIKVFEKALLYKLNNIENCMDTIILSNIAEILIELPNVSRDIINEIHRLIVFKSDSIIKYISRFNKINKYLMKYQFTNQLFEEKFTEAVLEHLEKFDGIGYITTTSYGMYFLTNKYHSMLHNKVCDHYSRNIFKWNIADLCELGMALKYNCKNKSFYLRKKFLKIYGNVQSEILKRLPEINSLNCLHNISKTLIYPKFPIDPMITEAILKKYAYLTKSINQYELLKLIQILSNHKYYYEELFENLCSTIYLSNDFPNFLTISLLALISKSGYQPKEVKIFTNKILNIYNQYINSNSIMNSLTILNDLSKIQIFPSDELKQFFTLENINNIEYFISGNPDKEDYVEKMLMELNRSVVIECPEFDLPWFNEQYCQEEFLNKPTSFEDSMKMFIKDEIYEILCTILSSQDYIKRNCYSSYFHKIDFECSLDKELIPYTIEKVDNLKNDYRKLAINLLTDSAYCTNSRVLTGDEQMRKRQLQILGYTVIEIPYYEWFSMALSKYSTRYEYIQEKLMNI